MTGLKLMQPQEIEVLYILPAIRRGLAIEMKLQGMEQKKIADLLCVSEAAVSQYLKSKRAAKVKFEKKFQDKIRKSASKIKIRKDMLNEIQSLLRDMRDAGLICKVHKGLADLPDKCGVCFSE